ncbi:MAG: hypothetical protein HXY42_02515 [Chloroflexi bacterium]|nr:hypothetical protein [Chloroflexota bacterium]
MNDGQRIMGMTRMQVGIVAGMAGALILLLCAGGWLVLRGNPLAAKAPNWTPTHAPTVTPVVVVTPTVNPTITPTPIPYEQLIPAGWKHYQTPLVEIWLPDNFKLADKKTKNITAGFARNELLITEIPSKSSAYTMLVSVSYDLMTGDSLDAFLEAKIPTLPYQARVADRRMAYVNTVEARRIVVEFKINNIDYNDLIYVFLDGSTVWYVEYVAQINEFFENLPVFEESIKTFRVVRY